MGDTPARSALLALVPLFLSSCLSVTWEHHRRHAPLPEGALEQLRVDRSDLTLVLAACGAPLRVWELPAGETAIAYGWYRERQLGAQISVPLFDRFSGSFSFDDFDVDLFGVVLTFDAFHRLRRLRRGYLRDLVTEPARRRPSFVATDSPRSSQRERRRAGSPPSGMVAAR
ncbi:MAG: hypothetical protein CMJ84_15050 [Planctomycetes bacterium]|nr:hypothetical protein [Planctomycetota bacterium]MDP6410209.1 hypothetical protein [Planctomycetota bacterium]